MHDAPKPIAGTLLRRRFRSASHVLGEGYVQGAVHRGTGCAGGCWDGERLVVPFSGSPCSIWNDLLALACSAGFRYLGAEHHNEYGPGWLRGLVIGCKVPGRAVAVRSEQLASVPITRSRGSRRGRKIGTAHPRLSRRRPSHGCCWSRRRCGTICAEWCLFYADDSGRIRRFGTMKPGPHCGSAHPRKWWRLFIGRLRPAG